MARSTVFTRFIDSTYSPDQVAREIAILLEAFDLLRMFGGKSVLIKPNLCGEDGNANTDPRVIYGVVRAMEKFAARLVVGDGAVIGTETTAVIERLGLPALLASTKAELVDFKRGNYVETRFPGGVAVKKAMVAQAVLKADAIVDIAKLKTHDATGVSLTIKNLKGMLHEYDNLRFHHVNLSDCLVDLAGAFRPTLSIVDGLIALDRYGPGDTPLGWIVAGEDMVAVDSVAARGIGIEPASIYSGTLNESHIKKASLRGLGEMVDIEVIGGSPDAQFTRPPASLSQIEVPDGMEIIDGDPCAACIGMLGSVLQKLNMDGKPRGKTTILVGPKAPSPEKTMGRTIIIGNCLHRLESEGSTFIVGCPPNATYDVLPILES